MRQIKPHTLSKPQTLASTHVKRVFFAAKQCCGAKEKTKRRARVERKPPRTPRRRRDSGLPLRVKGLPSAFRVDNFRFRVESRNGSMDPGSSPYILLLNCSGNRFPHSLLGSLDDKQKFCTPDAIEIYS